MKLALLGNLANNFYRTAVGLRKHSNIDVHLFLRAEENCSIYDKPESDGPMDAALEPNRIHYLPQSRYQTWKRILFGYKLSKELLDELNDFDLCVFSGAEILIAPQVSSKKIFRVTGGDFTVLPSATFNEFYSLTKNIDKRFQAFLKVKSSLGHYCMRWHFRKAIMSMDYLSYWPWRPYRDASTKLGISASRNIGGLRLMLDTSKFYNKKREVYFACKKWALNPAHFNIFLPSRIMINKTDFTVRTGQWKASDKAIEAVARFMEGLSPEETQGVRLLIPESELSGELIEAKELIKKLRIESNVVYLKGRSSQALSREEMVGVYSLADVVLDDFGAGWFGAAVLEALSCSCPVITYVPEAIMSAEFPWHPIISAREISEITNELFELYRSIELRRKIGDAGRRWIEEFHSEEASSKHMQQKLYAVLH